MKISESKLLIVSEAMEKLIQWASKTLRRLTRESSSLVTWLRSCHSCRPNPFPFRFPQEPTTVKRYVNHWKQFIFYVLHTSLLDEPIHERMYRIRFTEDQLLIIRELLDILDEYDHENEDGQQFEEEDDDIDGEDEDFHEYDPDEEGEDDEIIEESNVREFFINDEIDVDEEYSLFLTQVAEKIMQLSIAFITQHFPSGDNLHSPLVHFADIMGISNRYVRFNESYNYTSYVAGLTWICQFLIMEYALPSREYTTLG